jgi:serine/threonine protein kinase/Flp pilus assembly protein TadD
MIYNNPNNHNDHKPTIEPGTIILNYRIIGKIASGGMGDVYSALDLKLERQVALKFLPDWLKDDHEARDRLLNEARAASQINHPNLVSIYTIENAGGRDFIVMEYVEGESLSSLIDKSQLMREDKIGIVIQIASGLKAAHDKGTIHRDIKPENIIITASGQAKILDFGLAAYKGSIKSPESYRMTGTLLYSSPEQVQDRVVDKRSDIFSLGVLMYELFSGKRPFKGEYEAAIIYSIVNEEPPPIDEEIPQNIKDAIFKALQKNPEARYQDVSQLIDSLKEADKPVKAFRAASPSLSMRRQVIRTTALMLSLLAISLGIYLVFSFFAPGEEIHQKTLAVLPLENLGQPEDEYFADGMTDAIITELTKSSAVAVISLSSTMQYKDTDKDIQQIGRELGADYALIGTIKWLRDTSPYQIKINPKLIRIKDNTYIWAESYNPEPGRILDLQSEIAHDLSSALDLKLSEITDSTVRKGWTKNIEAYGLFIKGNAYFNRGWEEKDLLIAAEMYEKAIKLDSDFAMAYAMLSRVHACLYWDYYDRSEARINQSRAMIDNALKLAPDLPDAKLALGSYYYSKMDYEPALDLFLEVLRVQPSNIEAIAAVAGVYRRRGEPERAIEYYMKAYKLDPRSNVKAFDVGLTYAMMRKYPEAIAYLDKSISLAPDWPMSYILKAWLYLFSEGNVARAREAIADASTKANLEQSEYYWWLLRIIESNYGEAIRKAQLKADTTSYYLHLARLYGLSDDATESRAYYDSARVILENKIAGQPDNARLHSQLGLAYAGLGMKDQAIAHGVKAATILPPSREAIYSLFFLINLAEIYVLVGEDDKAIEQLQYSMQIPGFVSPPYLRLDPVWRPLRENPRFIKLLDGGA